MIGILAPDFGDGYDSVLLSGIEHHLLNHDYIYFVSSHLWSPHVLSRSLDTLIERGAEGLLLINTPLPTAVQLPAVAIGSENPVRSISTIAIDNYYGMWLVVDHLAQLGHRRIAIFKGHQGSSDTKERFRGALTACAELGLELPPEGIIELERISVEGIFGIDEGYIAATKLLQRGLNFTALVCFNDMSACGAMNAIRDAGLRIPEDISVVGFDDLSLARIVYPTLTTVHQPLREMGEQAATILIDRIEKRTLADEQIRVKPSLIVRNSTSVPAVR